MRIIVFFDLPTGTRKQRSAYNNFRKFLLKQGFIMMQYSVYSKITLTNAIADSAIRKVKQNAPSEGYIQILKITEKQYVNIININHENRNDEKIDSLDRVVVL